MMPSATTSLVQSAAIRTTLPGSGGSERKLVEIWEA
jgi:hypothetical protein